MLQCISNPVSGNALISRFQIMKIKVRESNYFFIKFSDSQFKQDVEKYYKKPAIC